MGLLDGFFAQPGEDEKFARNMAIFSNLRRGGDIPGGLLQAQQGLLREKLLKAQIEETMAQGDERKANLLFKKQAQDRQDRLLHGDPGDGGGGGISPGTFSPSAGGYGYTAPRFDAPGNGGGGLLGQARGMGIPEQAIQADMAFNGGKGISDMLFKRGTPDMQVTNGYAYDKNKQGAGFMPFLNNSQTGQTSMGRIGPDGLPFVSAPQGAMETYQGYRNVDEGIKANFDPVTVTPQGQPPQMTSRGALMRNPQVQGGGQSAQIPPAQQAQRDQGRVEILNQELTKAQDQLKQALQVGDAAAANRAATDVSSLNRELGRAGGQSRATAASVGMPLESEAEKAKALADAKAAADRDATMQKGATNSRDTLAYIKQARDLFKKGPTASGIGSAIDAGANLFGMSTPGADAAAQLDTLSGWMVSNVPRMEGPQSNFDVQNYKTMAGMVGDKTKPLSQRMAALDTLEKLQEKYAHLNSGQAPGNQTPAPAAQTFQQLPSASQYNGKVATNPATGQRMRSNGLTWVEVK